MEYVKHHVDRSGNSSLRGFFGSDSVDFDPPSLSLRQNIMKAKAKVVYDLASGFTPASEERAIRDLMKDSENSYELIRMVGAIEGWEGLDSELEYDQVDQVATQLAQVLDQRDYVVYQLIRRYLILLDYNASPNLGDCFVRLLLWPNEFQAAEFDLLLSRKSDFLKGITSATMRGRKNMVDAARIHINVIAQYLAGMPHRATDLMALMFEANYTTRICVSLVALDYKPLYDVVADMVNPARSNLERAACRDTCQRLSLEFSAAAKVVELVGSNEAKTTINRFMRTLKAALDNFPTTLPTPTAVGAIVAALGGVGTTFGDLLTTITNLPDAFADIIDISNILNTSDDDKARQLISELNSQGMLARVAFTVKLKLVNALLSGSTGDEDEDAILRVMEAAKAYDQAELYQLTAAATWDSLYSSVDGEQYDQLVNTLQQPV
ncbi:MAG: hypothetical protein WCH01_11680 [Methylococcaceae bacterium]